MGISSLHADYSGLEVRIASTRLARVPHGAGFFRTLDRQSSSIAADRFGLFYGGFAKGKRAGSGFEVNDAGVFTGIKLETHLTYQGVYMLVYEKGIIRAA